MISRRGFLTRFGPSRPYIVMTASVAGPPHGNYRKIAVIETDGTTLPWRIEGYAQYRSTLG